MFEGRGPQMIKDGLVWLLTMLVFADDCVLMVDSAEKLGIIID